MFKKIFLLTLIMFVSAFTTGCVNNFAVQELNNKAKAALDSGDYETAISRLKSSIDLDDTIFATHYNLGIAYTQAEEYPQAVEAFKKASEINPNSADLFYSLAVADENFAKGIIDGSIKMDKKGEFKPVKNMIEDADDTVQSQNRVKLTKEQKEMVADIFNDAILSYNTYLEKAKNPNDSGEVQDKIGYLKTQTHKYAPEKYEAPDEIDKSESSEDFVQ